MSALPLAIGVVVPISFADVAYVFADLIQNCARSDLGTAILAALVDAGKDVNHLQPEDLAPVDEFHTRGPRANN